MQQAEFSDWVGRSELAEDVLTPRLASEFHATLSPHLAECGDGDAPLGSHWCLAPAIRPADELGPDGHPRRGGFLPPVPLPRRMWAGGEIEFLHSLRIGDVVTRRSTIASIEHKEGRTGVLCFVAVRHEFTANGSLAISERQDIVYRDVVASAAPPPSPAEPRPTTGLMSTVMGSAVLLFRYSAVTFNGHRIHYDEPYVTKVENYPGLVVHGPMQATLLMNLAAKLGDRPPRRFAYRGTAPLIAGQAFDICAEQAQAGAECRVIDATGQVTMRATASW
ncbi:3-methylfumaryl-CoA hydratase [Rhizobiales bacterium GAS191]|nr:3-methylfumaryl-CoA hydratase [Rhizobiales bacterium GAS113]SED69303.1 3-methylfumaryl-CoA hydratase [Rhizobiales bacterium GAS188]SEE82838.1 3-methylfumaryl-CoA hydratase [Rhizobiales bacterium GAS191]